MAQPIDLDESDFDRCFLGEPPDPPAGADLARGRARRHRRWGVAGAVGGVAILIAAALSVLPGVGQLDAAPTDRHEVATPSPAASATVPTGPPTLVPGPTDTAPPLTYIKKKGYLDKHGRDLSSLRADPFQATTKHTYNLVRAHLDPHGRHLDPYSAGFSGGGGRRSIQVGQKLGWSVTGEQGQGMLLVSVTRMAPGVEPRTAGDERDGLCAGSSVDATCRPDTVDGRKVSVARLPGGGYVVDYLQPDGEVASAWVDPLFGNNTSIPLKSIDVPLEDVVGLLADPQLDVIG
jgi:hypothetical protein